jgi:hypothetical protein
MPRDRAAARRLRRSEVDVPHVEVAPPGREPAATLRVARPTDHLEEVVRFYTDGLGLARLGAFEDPDGYRVVLQNAASPV